MQKKLITERKSPVSIMTIQRAIKGFNYTSKRIQLILVARNTELNINKRYEYASEYFLLNEDRVVFADEMGVNCSSRLSYGRSVAGKTPKKEIRSIQSRNMSISAAMNKVGILFYKPIFQTYNGERFCEFIRNLLNILDEKGMVNSIIIMDNCFIHKVEGVRNLIISRGHTLVFFHLIHHSLIL